MRFLFVNQYYAPDFAATAQQLADLCEQLAESGHEVHVLTSRSLYDGRKMELPQEEVLNGVHVHRIGLLKGGRARFRDRLKDYLSFYVKAFWKVHFLPRADVIVTLTTPPMISLLGTWLRILRRTRFVYWVMDIYPDIALRAEVLSRVGPIRLIWSTLGRISYITANKIVVLGEDMKRTLMAKGVGDGKIDIIQSWSCGQSVHSVSPTENEFRREHTDDGHFTLMYSGNMGTCHTFEAFQEAAAKLCEEDEMDIQFLFIGSGKKESELRDALGKYEGHVKFLPYQDRSRLNQSLSASDAHLITLDARYDGLLVPSKLYGIMAAERPVLFIGSKDCDIARTIREAGCGIQVNQDDPQGVIDAINRMADRPEETREMGRRGREYFERHFDRPILCDRFRELLEQEAQKPGIRGVRRLAHKTFGHAHPQRRQVELDEPSRVCD
ncbi:glycosyltransferase family 4 protein [bacterium]|nr:glycosyltransferase family 4 protein [bacterium]